MATENKLIQLEKEPKAKLLCATPIVKNPNNLHDFIWSFELQYHQFFHKEMMTYRWFSRNARSSRATPTKVTINQVATKPWAPIVWLENQPGMVGEEITDPTKIEELDILWWQQAQRAVSIAETLVNGYNIHKSHVNALLEPFMPITTIVTTRFIQNFFYERSSSLKGKYARPEIRCLADKMQELCMNYIKDYDLLKGSPDAINHTPYFTDEDNVVFEKQIAPLIHEFISTRNDLVKTEKAKTIEIFKGLISAARCARVCVKPFNRDTADMVADLNLAIKLIDQKHPAVFEHVVYDVPHTGEHPENNFRTGITLRQYFSDEITLYLINQICNLVAKISIEDTVIDHAPSYLFIE